MDTAIISKSESKKKISQAGLNVSIMPCLQSSKPTKRCWTNTSPFQKQKTFDTEVASEVKDTLEINKRS